MGQFLKARPHRRFAHLRDGGRGHLHHLREIKLYRLGAAIAGGGLIELLCQVLESLGPDRI
jgi:hypothetical protein